MKHLTMMWNPVSCYYLYPVRSTQSDVPNVIYNLTLVFIVQNKCGSCMDDASRRDCHT